jgi:hypothetical protein
MCPVVQKHSGHIAGPVLEDPQLNNDIDAIRPRRKGRPWPPLEERFWAKVNKTGPTVHSELGPCWEWLGSKTPHGHGHITENGTYKTRYVHRISWDLHHPDNPCGPAYVLHRCDNPPCVRPDHLFLGSQADNVRDMIEKRRSPLGSQRKGGKLTEADIPVIRKLSADGLSQRAIAKLFGVHQVTISQIFQGTHWKHVP